MKASVIYFYSHCLELLQIHAESARNGVSDVEDDVTEEAGDESEFPLVVDDELREEAVEKSQTEDSECVSQEPGESHSKIPRKE